MSFKFTWLCQLLEELYRQRHRKRETSSKSDNPDHHVVNVWLSRYNDRIERTGLSALAFLSSLFPERRLDRVYNVQEKRLAQIFGRALGLGWSRARLLYAWQTRHGADFPTCVEQVMSECEFDPSLPQQQVTLEDIEMVLNQLAANSPYSSSTLRQRANDKTADELVAPIIRRLQSWEAKWFVRMLLKSYSPIEVPEYVALHGFHFMLPKLLQIQNSLEAAIDFLARPEIRGLPPRSSREYEIALQPIFAQQVRPQLGIMIRRQPYWKARSIKHCSDMAGQRTMSVERKYDGEYCQIHIDMSRGEKCIQIFSKSGKDSTQDREGLHEIIATSLNLAHAGCKIKTGCILEGELLVWAKDERKILPFYKIRKHVKHGGRFLGTDNDSPYSLNEQLMIVFYDLLVLNDVALIGHRHSERRSRLKALIREEEGYVQIVERTLIDFGSSVAERQLRETFASCIVKRWEGLVLKGADDPYFSWKQELYGVKLKKDYILGLGDVADLCILGGSRVAKVEAELGLGHLSWTMFHVGCLLNKPHVERYHAKPRFQVMNTIDHHSLSLDDIRDLNMRGRMLEAPFALDTPYFNSCLGPSIMPVPTELFREPLVVEIVGSGFEKPSNANFWTLRFPRKSGSRIKIHMDRDLTASTTFDELQAMALKATSTTSESDSREDAEWIDRLLKADPKSAQLEGKSQSTSPAKTPRSAPTASLTSISSRRCSTQKSPVLVRTDTSELTPIEKEQRLRKSKSPSSYNTDSTATPDPAEMRMYLKRKYHAIDQHLLSYSPIKHRKKICVIQSTPAASSMQSPSKVPPKASPSSTLLPADDPATKNNPATRVLSEIRNGSTSRKVQFAHSSTHSRYTGSPKLQTTKSNTQIGQCQSHSKISKVSRMVGTQARCAKKMRLAYEVETGSVANMPTPPPSDQIMEQQDMVQCGHEEDVPEGMDISPASITMGPRDYPQPEIKEKLSVSHNSNCPTRRVCSSVFNESRTRGRKQCTSLPFQPPIFIGASVVSNEQAIETVWQALRTVDTSFTFSLKEFVDDIILRQLTQGEPSNPDQLKPRRSIHMMLVNSRDTSASNKDLRMLARALATFCDSCTKNDAREPLILMFDYQVLTISRTHLDDTTNARNGASSSGLRLCSTASLSAAAVPIVDWTRLCVTTSSKIISRPLHGDDVSALFCGVADVNVLRGQGWGGRDAFSFEMKWDWNWLEELLITSATSL